MDKTVHLDTWVRGVALWGSLPKVIGGREPVPYWTISVISECTKFVLRCW